MLELKGIIKDYGKAPYTVRALKGIDVAFRKNEFVSVLGHSGCGKTTLLNIIGGLDRYTEGDLIIKGFSTKGYSDRDWDYYRNHSIGFVFQSYNLIAHQSVLANVELALTISGISLKERRERAIEALEKVGLKDHLHKKPNQMSGGQMQRVAIARALVNRPEILLADEPTGALDSETSIQIMEILKDIAKDRLVIMVTHNPDLANEYSTRIIRLVDGLIVSDSNPCTDEELKEEAKAFPQGKKKRRKTSMNFFTALSLSLNNLMTKKTRTILTSFAGSIGIIGIALILSLSSGFQNYIDRVEQDTLSSYPIQLEAEATDFSSILDMMSEEREEGKEEKVLDRVYTSSRMSKLMNLMNTNTNENNLSKFMDFIESGKTDIKKYTTAVQYVFDTNMQIYNSDTTKIQRVQPFNMYEAMGMSGGLAAVSGSYSGGMGSSWQELIDNKELLSSQYDVLAGRWPESFDEIVLFVNSRNEIDDSVLYSIGLSDPDEIPDLMQDIADGKELDTTVREFTYDELTSMTYKLVLAGDYYKEEDGVYTDMREDEDYMRELIDKGVTLKVVGIMRPSEQSVSTAVSGTVGYLHSLSEYVVNKTNELDIVKAQLKDTETDVFTGKPFADSEDAEDISFDISTLSPDQQMYIASLSDKEREELVKTYAASMVSQATYDGNIDLLGISDLDHPTAIYLYPIDFNSKEEIQAIIDDYNQAQIDDGRDADAISYTDMIGTFLKSVTTIVNTVSYVLIAFVAISLVVSSIMIGIITYISVLERTKEIGILRSMGASKKDISRVFNAETIIVGFISGIMGIGITLLLNIPINAIIYHYTSIQNVAKLPVYGSVVLIIISMLLTLIAGLIPSGLAAKKDPVVALRTE